MRHAAAAILLLAFIAPAHARQAPAAGSPWDRVLQAAGLTRDTARFDFLDMANWGGDEMLLPYFHAMHADPLRIPSYARIYRQAALTAAPSAGELAMLAAGRINCGTRLTLLGDPLADEAKRAALPGALRSAILLALGARGRKPTAAEVARATAGLERVPPDVAQQAALVLFVELRALKWRDRALAAAGPHDWQKVFDRSIGVNPDSDEALDDDSLAVMRRLDLKYMLVGGELVAMAADRAAAALAKRTGAERFVLDADTPLGRIALHGAQADTYPGDRPYLLTIDTGGDDTYHGGGATYDAAHPVSVLLDAAGDDHYLERPELAGTAVAQFAGRKKGSRHPAFGAGVLGYGVLVDAAGSDTYRSLDNTQGRGVFGLGMLVDGAGDDRYDCYMLGQGSAWFGVGVLGDLGGRDQYRCFTTSQGFGDTMGCGMLVDAGADDDLYEANDTVIDFPSAQSAQHNSSLAQGAGFGRRADFLDAHSLAGGIGALVDGGGTNSFACGIFGQGTGYWYGAGFLLTGPGDDRCQGAWYVQGAAAHFAVGVLYDAGGNDRYRATMNMAQGAGHDFSVGFLMDEAGNDRYEAPNLSLGGGNANGFGFLWDRAGDDTYVVAPSVTLGRAGGGSDHTTMRGRDLTLGVFLDTGGHDTYPAALPWAKDGALWTMAQSGPAPEPVTRGAGLDVDAPDTPEPG